MASAWTISSGSELIRGRSIDTNAAWLGSRLVELGVPSERHVTVADDPGALVDVLRQAANAADFVILTGGLGPTEDDLTRPALAELSGQPLVLDEESLHQIERFFAARRRSMPEANRRQAFLPHGARSIENKTGTAPGIHLVVSGAQIFALPGVPHEMKEMFERYVAPTLAQHATGQVIRYTCLHCYGRSESEIGADLKDLMQRGANPDVGTTASAGTIGIRIHAAGHSAPEAERLLEETISTVQQRLGNIIYGKNEDTLPSVVGGQLARLGRSIATAESCTGGMIGKQLTDVSGSSRYYRGGVITYSDDLKVSLLGVSADQLALHGAVSAGVAKQMAAGVRERLAADYGISTTGIAGPTGGSPSKPVGLVYVALAGADGVEVKELHLGADSPRFLIRERTIGIALNWLRLNLLADPQK